MLQGITPLERPRAMFAAIDGQHGVYPHHASQRVVAFEAYLCLDEVGARKLGPCCQQCVELLVGLPEVFQLQPAENAVIERTLVFGVLGEEARIVCYGIGIILQVDAA